MKTKSVKLLSRTKRFRGRAKLIEWMWPRLDDAKYKELSDMLDSSITDWKSKMVHQAELIFDLINEQGLTASDKTVNIAMKEFKDLVEGAGRVCTTVHAFKKVAAAHGKGN